jgi:hydroxymethylpyrimidine/phosphomethylpyrimidine kinase
MAKIPQVLSIAGFDSSAGAGLQADLKTISAFKCYAHTVLTALPVQNTCGVRNIYTIPTIAITEQLMAVIEDTKIDAIKIGMLFNTEIIEVIANFLVKYAKNIPIVLDPVMVAKSGHNLLQVDAQNTLKKLLFPLSTLITPNIPEAEVICSNKIQNTDDMEKVAQDISNKYNVAVLLKGGHLQGNTMQDFLYTKDIKVWINAPKIKTKNTHGTGCTLSASIASNLALGYSIEEACRIAKNYLYNALLHSNELNVGKGQGPVHHFYELWKCE